MLTYFAAVGSALFLWWFSTGLILYLNHLQPNTYRWSMSLASVVMGLCLLGMRSGADDVSTLGAFIAFAQALAVWAWIEMSYFTGLITGPRKQPCPADLRGWPRFILAVQTSLYHELLVIAMGLFIFVLTWDLPNHIAIGTFATLWFMRWSAKLNLFLGVPNVNAEWFPAHLRFLTTYMRRRSMNLFFPFSVTIATALVTVLVALSIDPVADFKHSGYVLIASLMALAVLEHWFMVLPLRDSALWDWALRAAARTSTAKSGRLKAPRDTRQPLQTHQSG
jgi:putative photosynthetic complex assembly protein 2